MNVRTKLEAAQFSRRAALQRTGVGLVASLAAASGVSAAFGADKPQISHVDVTPPQTEFSYEALVTVAGAVEVGPSARGTRRYIPITGGSFAGPKLKGVVLPGGADWQLERPDGVLEIDALYSIKADDGAVIIVHNRGIIAGDYVRTSPQFEAPKGPHDWLNRSIFVGTLSGARQPGAVVIRVFRVL